MKSSAEVQQDFLQTLSDVTSAGLYSVGGMLSFPAFLDFYCSLTAFTSDEDFRWGYRDTEVCFMAMFQSRATLGVHQVLVILQRESSRGSGAADSKKLLSS